ncbi:MAG: Smr/MutS family protein [Bacteroidetes bacterium]|nr:Smr/MutS family protein [Bacteroidota bacterium]
MFSKGDKVGFLNERGGGTFVKYVSKLVALVEIDNGFEIEYEIKYLVPVKTDYSKPTVEQLYLSAGKERPKKNVLLNKRKSSPDVLEVDLHIHELIDSYKNLSNWDMLQIQLEHLKRKLEFAQRSGIKKVVVIHGVGEGVLKHEIKKVLSGMTRLEYFDASYKKYGFGATEINFR